MQHTIEREKTRLLHQQQLYGPAEQLPLIFGCYAPPHAIRQLRL